MRDSNSNDEAYAEVLGEAISCLEELNSNHMVDNFISDWLYSTVSLLESLKILEKEKD